MPSEDTIPTSPDTASDNAIPKRKMLRFAVKPEYHDSDKLHYPNKQKVAKEKRIVDETLIKQLHDFMYGILKSHPQLEQQISALDDSFNAQVEGLEQACLRAGNDQCDRQIALEEFRDKVFTKMLQHLDATHTIVSLKQAFLEHQNKELLERYIPEFVSPFTALPNFSVPGFVAICRAKMSNLLSKVFNEQEQFDLAQTSLIGYLNSADNMLLRVFAPLIEEIIQKAKLIQKRKNYDIKTYAALIQYLIQQTMSDLLNGTFKVHTIESLADAIKEHWQQYSAKKASREGSAEQVGADVFDTYVHSLFTKSYKMLLIKWSRQFPAWFELKKFKQQLIKDLKKVYNQLERVSNNIEGLMKVKKQCEDRIWQLESILGDISLGLFKGSMYDALSREANKISVKKGDRLRVTTTSPAVSRNCEGGGGGKAADGPHPSPSHDGDAHVPKREVGVGCTKCTIS